MNEKQIKALAKRNAAKAAKVKPCKRPIIVSLTPSDFWIGPTSRVRICRSMIEKI